MAFLGLTEAAGVTDIHRKKKEDKPVPSGQTNFLAAPPKGSTRPSLLGSPPKDKKQLF